MAHLHLTLWMNRFGRFLVLGKRIWTLEHSRFRPEWADPATHPATSQGNFLLGSWAQVQGELA